MAVAFHPDFEYVALAAGDEVYIVAAELAAATIAACNLGATTELARFKGSKLDRVTFQHPFLDRSILGVNAAYVTADTGTGAVHTAPSHGADDFYTGQRYGLDPTSRVDAGGDIHFANGSPPAAPDVRQRTEGPIGNLHDPKSHTRIQLATTSAAASPTRTWLK